MDYRRLGRSGLQVSVLSFGSWVTFGEQMNLDRAMECLDAAYQAGVNFFDNAESYAGGKSESIMGEAISKLRWPRYSYVVSTKVFWGLHELPNMQNTLNRKYLLQAIDGSLERLGLDFVDLLFCHRADPNTPIEETTRAMSDIVSSGKATYWGTSEWTPDEIRAAWEIADKNGWHKPVMEQSCYNLMRRMRIEIEYLRLYDEIGLGTTIYSPLASGVLSGKYLDGVPSDSRGALEGYEWLSHSINDTGTKDKVRALKAVADDLGCTTAQLAIAWCTKNRHVSTVITGASRPEQVTENMVALDVAKRLDRDVMARIEAAVPFTG